MVRMECALLQADVILMYVVMNGQAWIDCLPRCGQRVMQVIRRIVSKPLALGWTPKVFKHQR